MKKGKFFWNDLILAVAAVAVLFLLVSYFNDGQISRVGAKNYSEIEVLKEGEWDFRELSKFFTQLAEDEGGGYAYRALAEAASLGYFSPDVDQHLLGHVVGDIIFDQENIEGIKHCTDDMRNACSHSIVVGAFIERGTDALPDVKEACKKAPGGSGAYGLCIHGLGHGILAYFEYDMEGAIKFCEKLSPAGPNIEYSECAGGVAMEMMSGINDLEAWGREKDKYFRKDSPLSPCDMDFMTEEASRRCYSFLSQRLFELAGADLAMPEPQYFSQAFSFCNGIPAEEEKRRASCFGGFGKEFVGLANARNIQNVSQMNNEQLATVYEWCNLSPEEGVEPCLDSALMSLYWGGENERGGAIRFCGVMSEEHQSFCFSRLIGAVGHYIKDSNYRREFCDEVPDAHAPYCKKVMNI